MNQNKMLNDDNISGLKSRVNTAEERISERHGVSSTSMPKVKHREKDWNKIVTGHHCSVRKFQISIIYT